MKMLESVQKALKLLHGSFINRNNEIILIPKFNVYTLLDDVQTDNDFKAKLCEWFSRDCCCALRYSQHKRNYKYYQDNTDVFNLICGTHFTVEEMGIIYQHLGNCCNHPKTIKFIESGFDLAILKGKNNEFLN